jgi:hypothetical protein
VEEGHGVGAGKIEVIPMVTCDPATVPVSVPCPEVVPYMPESDDPVCEMLNPMTQESMWLGGHVVPFQVPATSAIVGVVGDESHATASARTEATASAARTR